MQAQRGGVMTSPRVKRIGEALARLPAASTASGTVLVAIDGRAGCGKTTLAAQLAAADPSIRVFHADELQRPQDEGEWKNWTPRECAANLVEEEPLRQVLSQLAAGQQARYQPYDWSAHRLGPPQILAPGGVVVVEGAYALRPSLRSYYALKIWVECAEDVRAARLRARPAPSPGWLEAWLAGEEFYVEHDNPAGIADIVIPGNAP